MKRKILFILLQMVLCLFLLNCSKQSNDVSAEKVEKSKDTLNYGIAVSPEGKFNPLVSNTQYDGYVNTLVYDSLLKLNSKIELESSMAEKYEITNEGKKTSF
jgi:oligopeptide ABC transporter, oligopeptide-binding protein appA